MFSKKIGFILMGVLGFAIGGAISGFILNASDNPLAFALEGAMGGLFLGLARPHREKTIRFMLAVIAGITIGLLSGVFFALTIFDGYDMPVIISGLLSGGIIGTYYRNLNAVVLLALLAAIGFSAGDSIFNLMRVDHHPVFMVINRILGQLGWSTFGGGLTGMFHGLSLGIGMAFMEKDKKDVARNPAQK